MTRWLVPLSILATVAGIGAWGFYQQQNSGDKKDGQVAQATTGEGSNKSAQVVEPKPIGKPVAKPIPLEPETLPANKAPRRDPFAALNPAGDAPTDAEIPPPAPIRLANPRVGSEIRRVGDERPLPEAPPAPVRPEFGPPAAGPIPTLPPAGPIPSGPLPSELPPSEVPTSPLPPASPILPRAAEPAPLPANPPGRLSFGPPPGAPSAPAPLNPVATNPASLGPAVLGPPAPREAAPPAGDDRPLSPIGGPAALGPAALGPSAAGPGGAGRPGSRDLEGLQAPALQIEKLAPPEVQVGKPARFDVKIKNTGKLAANEVVVRDEVPQGTRFLDATPNVAPAGDGSLTWTLGRLEPGAEASVSFRVLPENEGEVGSVAQVTFSAAASSRSICTRPQLTVEHTAPAKVLIGDSVVLKIRVANIGSGAATGVVLQEDVPEGLSHPAGSQLEYDVGVLKPGESRELELALKAAKAGQVQNLVLVRGEGNLSAEHRVNVEVIAPQMTLAIDGPRRRFLDRAATYKVTVSNPGTAPAREIELVAWLPKGFQFTSTNNAGQYNPQTHAVYWSLAELPPEKQGAVELVALPSEIGEHKIRIESKAQMGLVAAQEQTVIVEGLAALFFEVVDAADPIEVGQDTVYEIRVVNQGSKPATDVRVVATLPPGLKPIAGEGAARAQINGTQVAFEPLARLAPKADAIFKVRAQGAETGDHRVSVQVFNSDITQPVTKEESTRVYSDR